MVHKILFIDLIPQNLNISPPVKGPATKHTNKEFATNLTLLIRIKYNGQFTNKALKHHWIHTDFPLKSKR